MGDPVPDPTYADDSAVLKVRVIHKNGSKTLERQTLKLVGAVSNATIPPVALSELLIDALVDGGFLCDGRLFFLPALHVLISDIWAYRYLPRIL